MQNRWIWAASIALVAASAWAGPSGDHSGAWQVSGVPTDGALRARRGPGMDYEVIAAFGARERNLQQLACVPFEPLDTAIQLTQAERDALPPAWCLIRSPDGREGWVERRHLRQERPDAKAAAADAPKPEQTTGKASASHADAGCTKPWVAPTDSIRTGQALAEIARRDEERFLNIDGFAPLDPWPDPASDEDDFLSPERFPGVDGPRAWKLETELATITRAMLQFDFLEGTIEYPRYLITYHVEHTPPNVECAVIETAYIQITRFNLGAERYKDIIASYDREFWPSRDEFGYEPHVSWRAVATARRYLGHYIGPVTRRVLSDAEAQAADCLGTPCLSLDSPRGPVLGKNTTAVGDWQRHQPYDHEPASFIEPGYSWDPGPARMADLMYLETNGGRRDNLAPSEGSSQSRPEITMVISRNIFGQDDSSDALLRRRGLMDDVLAEEWLRLSVLPDPQYFWEKIDVHWQHSG